MRSRSFVLALLVLCLLSLWQMWLFNRNTLPEQKPKPILAICAPTHSVASWSSLSDTSLQTLLIPSIERTLTEKELELWDVRLYLGIDHDDAFWLEHTNSLRRPSWLTIERGFYKTPKHRIPNREMTKHAYDDGAEYIVRLNDDTEFVTAGWVTMGVAALRAFDPPNVGVVGPTQSEGKTERIMVHDMVHRTHLEIFEHYYPLVFDNWWLDDWITKVYQPNRSKQLVRWVAKHHTGKHGTRYKVSWGAKRHLEQEVAKGKERIAQWVKVGLSNRPKFRLIVLTKNRPASLQRLLRSVATSDYGNDVVSVEIRVDGADSETRRVAETFQWPHKTVAETRAAGLRGAWLGAWTDGSAHAIILEDDVELSPAWYGWLTRAWKVYGDRDDLAGISLQRQTLVPQKPSKTVEIVNGHQPFLYKLVGSIGFSPHPERWREFLEWVATKELDTFDAHVEGLITSDWYKTMDKKTMWTQLFLRFCEERALYTLYVNLPERTTLAAHWREKGEHFRGGEGKDFELATTVKAEFPSELVKYGWDGWRLVAPSTSPEIAVAPSHPTPTVVPIVFTALDYQLFSHVPQYTIPFLCERNDKVVVLTNVPQQNVPNADCLEVVDVGSYYSPSVKEMPWPVHAPGNQKVFFDRWYVLRNWMRRTSTAQAFTMDSDAVMTLNITNFVASNAVNLRKHEVWIVYNPPRSSLPYALITERALSNITAFWNQMFKPNIWTQEFVGGTEPNDMVAMGHYSHTAVGKPYPCWGYGPEHLAGSCDDSIDFGHTKVLERLVEHGVRAAYPPGTLTLNSYGNAPLAQGVVDNNYRHDPIQRYVMHNGQKHLRFWKGTPQLERKDQSWINAWGYILEDETEACVGHHLANIRAKRTCVCMDWCCTICQEASAVRNKAVPSVTRLNGVRRTGTEYGGWTYNATGLTPKSVVYSVGIGEDTSWDEAMMHDHGLHVWGFDPTHKSIQYVKRKTALGGNFHFTAEGLATQPGTLTFTKPANPDHVSMRQGHVGGMGETIDVPVNTLERWMEKNGHTHLDILKLDIEGSEYDVLEDWMTRKWFPMDQLLVEFHHRFLNDKSRHARVLSGLKDSGFEVIHDANGQEISFQRRARSTVWGRPSILNAAARLHAAHGVVLLQLLNEGYVEMTKSWICNVRRFGDVLPKTLFVTTDRAAYDALTAFDTSLNVVLEPYPAPKSMKYGQTAYYKYMLFRTKLILSILLSNWTLWLTESDAVWLKDPTDLVLGTEGDLVTMSDGRPPRKLLQGGFQLLRPTGATKRLWRRMSDAFSLKMEAVSEPDIGDHGSEQLMLDQMIREDPELTVGWLDFRAFAPGHWYTEKNRNTDATVVLNNWIIGNDAKIKRAKEWKHWFLDDQGGCSFIFRYKNSAA